MQVGTCPRGHLWRSDEKARTLRPALSGAAPDYTQKAHYPGYSFFNAAQRGEDATGAGNPQHHDMIIVASNHHCSIQSDEAVTHTNSQYKGEIIKLRPSWSRPGISCHFSTTLNSSRQL